MMMYFQYVKDEISEADIAIANFEVTLAGPPYKGYPTFSSPASLASACLNAGIDVFATANNHAADRGNKGILNTIYRLDSLGIPHTGTFTDPAARDTLYPDDHQKKWIFPCLAELYIRNKWHQSSSSCNCKHA